MTLRRQPLQCPTLLVVADHLKTTRRADASVWSRVVSRQRAALCVSSMPSYTTGTHDPPHEQGLVGVGVGAIRRRMAPYLQLTLRAVSRRAEGGWDVTALRK